MTSFELTNFMFAVKYYKEQTVKFFYKNNMLHYGKFGERTEETSVPETNIAKIIDQRRKIERERNEKGLLSFEALKSNFSLFSEKPEVFPKNPRATELSVLKDDLIIQNGLKSELEKYKLKPDNQTFYLIDIGLPHIPSLQSALLDLEIDPGVYVAPSKEHLNEPSSAGHFSRYINAYEVLREELFQKREKLAKAKGHALMINSHAESEEARKIVKIFPSPERLKQLGIRRLVFAEEAFFREERKIKDYEEIGGSISAYLLSCHKAGIEVKIIGIDYRYRNRAGRGSDSLMIEDERGYF